MTSKQLVQKIYLRIGKFKLLVLLCGAILGALLFIYAKSLPTVYSTRASVFPLTTSNENNSASSAITQLLGGGETAKSLSQEASISFVDLATSRNTREAVAMTQLPAFGNKTIAELLIDNYNKTKKFYTPPLVKPKDPALLAAMGANLINDNFTAKAQKSGILEITYQNTDQALISPVTYEMINKISQFYIDLKIRKAKRDYDFTVRKLDSLQQVVNTYDRRAVIMANGTRFVPKDRIEFSIAKENLINSKERGVRQRDALSNNREEALWRLQKATPIIQVLDKPERPFNQTRPSAVLYSIGGFILGAILGVLLLISPILYRYMQEEMNKAIFGTEEIPKNEPVVTTTIS